MNYTSKKGKQREKLLKLKDKLKQQKALLYQLYILPIDDTLKVLDKVLHGQDSVEHLQYQGKVMHNYLLEALGGKNGKSKRGRKNV